MNNPIFNIVGNTYTVQVTDSITLDITIVMTQSGDISYTFKTPKGWAAVTTTACATKLLTHLTISYLQSTKPSTFTIQPSKPQPNETI